MTVAAYYAAAQIGIHLAYPHTGTSTYGAVTAFWPPVGVGIAALVLFGLRLWPAVVIGDLLAGDYSTPLGVTLGQTLGTVVAVVVVGRAAHPSRGPPTGPEGQGRARPDRLHRGRHGAGRRPRRACDLGRGRPAGAREPRRIWRTWWLSDLAGALVVDSGRADLGDHARAPDQAPEAPRARALIVRPARPDRSGLAARRAVRASSRSLIWAALRFGPRGAAAALLAASLITIWDTSNGTGPFVRSSLTDSLLATQLFVAVAALTSMILAAVTAERAASEAAARGLAREQAALRRIATLLVSEADPARIFGAVMREAALALGVNTATIVRYDAPRTVCVLGGWSKTGELLFPAGSVIEIGEEGSALVEVYRTGEARRVSYPKDAGRLIADLRSRGYRSSVAAPVKLAGGLWGALVASSVDESPLPDGSEQRLCDFADLVAQALANADAHAKLAASRARIVGAGDAERRRLERNLHDGAQQRLVSLALQLRLTQSALERRPDDGRRAARGGPGRARARARRAARAGARHPPRDPHRPRARPGAGGDPRARTAARRAHRRCPDERLPEPVEAAVYYVVAETITNIAKHAQAESATVSVTLASHTARVVITDDGIGGADPARGTGLRGLADRIEALDGGLRIESPHGRGTRIEAQIPCELTRGDAGGRRAILGAGP